MRLLSGSKPEVTLLSDGRGRLPPELVFSDVPPDRLARALSAPPADVPYGCLLVRTRDGSTVLVDSGLGGAEHPLGGRGGELARELAAAGVAADAVDLVLVTHGHPDHIGGLVADGRPAFPSARYVMPRGEWDLWTSEEFLATLPPEVADPPRAQLRPLAGVIETFGGDTELAPGVLVLEAPGHTPGHVAVEIGESDGVLYAADALTYPLQVEHPEWGRGVDADPEAAVESRGRLLSRAAERGHLLAASHWDVVGHVANDDGVFELRMP